MHVQFYSCLLRNFLIQCMRLYEYNVLHWHGHHHVLFYLYNKGHHKHNMMMMAWPPFFRIVFESEKEYFHSPTFFVRVLSPATKRWKFHSNIFWRVEKRRVDHFHTMRAPLWFPKKLRALNCSRSICAYTVLRVPFSPRLSVKMFWWISIRKKDWLNPRYVHVYVLYVWSVRKL